MDDTATTDPIAPTLGSLHEAPLDVLVPSPNNPRTQAQDDAFRDLVASIQAVGVIEPIVCRPLPDGRFEICCGERRVAAARKAGLTEIPAIVRELSDDEALEITVTENMHRRDLTPIEESRGVNTLLERAGWSMEDVAEKLGRSPSWVARRAKIKDLTPRWQAELEREGALPWPIGHLELIARMEPHIQDDLVAEWGDSTYASLPTLDELQRHIDTYLHLLSAAPWDPADGDLVPEAGACEECLKRSDRQPLLWEDLRKGDPAPRCLDGQCWRSKGEAQVLARVAELQAEHGEAVLLIKDGYRDAALPIKGQCVQDWEVKQCSARGQGARPCVAVTGPERGKVFWAKLKHPERATGGNAKGPKTMAEKRAMLEARRRAHVIDAVRAAVGQRESPPPAEDLLRLAWAFGTDHKRDWHDGESWPAYRSTLTDLELRADFWLKIRPVLAKRLNYYTKTECTLDEATELADWMGLDLEELQAAAAEALPEPKAWAKGTKKPAAAKGQG